MPEEKNKPETINLREFGRERAQPPEKPEILPTPDRHEGFEAGQEQAPEKLPETGPEQEAGAEGRSGEAGGLPSVGQRPARQKRIEKVLAKDLDDYYLAMTGEKRREFKRAGEETARKINDLLEQGKVKAQRVIDLIRRWLSLIPGINKFFVEQEAKIKTDEIMKMS